MKNNTFLKSIFLALFTLLCCEYGFAQTQTADFYNVKSGVGKGLRFWGSDNFKIHMGHTNEYEYGPVTGYCIKTNMTNSPTRGWAWGVNGETPVTAINTQGKFQTANWIKSMARRYYFGDKQNLYGDDDSVLSYTSNNSNYAQFLMKDREGKRYGTLFGGNDGANFGLLDGDGDWSYLAAKDNYTAFRINDDEKMRITTAGNVGIGESNPQNKLDVCGTIRGKEVKVESGWCDYVFTDDYQMPTLAEEAKHIEENGHLLSFESAEEMNGEIQLGEVTKRQQETIEKLMLYVIEMDKEMKALKAQIK